MREGEREREMIEEGGSLEKNLRSGIAVKVKLLIGTAVNWGRRPENKGSVKRRTMPSGSASWPREDGSRSGLESCVLVLQSFQKLSEERGESEGWRGPDAGHVQGKRQR